MIELAAAADLPGDRVGSKARMLGRARQAGFLVPPGVVLPPGSAVDLAELRLSLGPGPCAVRSSAPDEDSANESRAGHYQTRLDVELDEIPAVAEAVGVVSAEWPGERSRRIPVLIQPMVAARSAGVAFSIDPHNGDDTTCVVEMVPGTGDALTDGRTVPATFRASALTGTPRGTTREPGCPPHEIGAVVDIVRAVAEWLGYPCDIEWAWDGERLWLLQARPVTAVGYQAAAGQWTSANFRETMPGLVTPLTASTTLGHVFPAALTRSLHEIGLVRAGSPVTEGRRIYGRAYWRVDLLKDVLVRLPGFVERSFDTGVGIEPTYAGSGRRCELSPAAWLRVPRLLTGLWRHDRRVLKDAVAHRDSDAERDRHWLSLHWDQLPDRVLSERFLDATRLHEQTYRHSLHVSFLAEQTQDLLRALLQQVNRHLDSPAQESILLGELGELRTGAAGRALEELARGTRERAEVLAAPGIDALPPTARAGLDAVVREFGYLAEADDELAQPRWDEDPALAFSLFKAAIRASMHNAAGLQAQPRSPHAEEERRVLRAAWPWSPVLRSVLRIARRYTRLREDLRVSAARANRIARRAHLAVGERWAQRGMLDAPADIFWLTRDEVMRALDSDLDGRDLAARVKARRAHARCFRNWEPPATLGAQEGPRPPAPDAPAITGIPCSAGVAEGRVRVLLDLNEIGDVEAGSILVIRYANPGWAPAYVAASGLVTEEGGLLSHGSILARERGLPAVIAVKNATRRLSDGQFVRVDGTEGKVTVLP